MLFTQSTLIRRINDLTVDKGMFASVLKRMENQAKSDDDEFDEAYYEVLELHDSCGEMIELYTTYFENSFNKLSL